MFTGAVVSIRCYWTHRHRYLHLSYAIWFFYVLFGFLIPSCEWLWIYRQERAMKKQQQQITKSQNDVLLSLFDWFSPHHNFHQFNKIPRWWNEISVGRNLIRKWKMCDHKWVYTLTHIMKILSKIHGICFFSLLDLLLT